MGRLSHPSSSLVSPLMASLFPSSNSHCEPRNNITTDYLPNLILSPSSSSLEEDSEVDDGEEEELRRGYIEHSVSKLDTLVGIAIKYGVEVSDIKRFNGLVSDLQMFAHKTLRIPLPGRHPPSIRSTTNGSSSFNSFSISSFSNKGRGKNVTSAMSLLRGYYGLCSKTQSNNNNSSSSNNNDDDDDNNNNSQTCEANGFQFMQETKNGDQQKVAKGVVRRRGKGDIGDSEVAQEGMLVSKGGWYPSLLKGNGYTPPCSRLDVLGGGLVVDHLGRGAKDCTNPTKNHAHGSGGQFCDGIGRSKAS